MYSIQYLHYDFIERIKPKKVEVENKISRRKEQTPKCGKKDQYLLNDIVSWIFSDFSLHPDEPCASQCSRHKHLLCAWAIINPTGPKRTKEPLLVITSKVR
jgi:hypothetical protein